MPHEMTHGLVDVLKHALMITGFVFMMMLVIEYVNVLTRGTWQKKLTGHRWGQYVLAAFLGATPGCLGAFAVVAMYAHRTVTVGAVVSAMVATSGDEAFVMLAMIPKQGLLVIGVLFALAVPAGALTDAIFGRRLTARSRVAQGFEVHEEYCDCFPRGAFVQQWRDCTAARGILAAGLAIFTIALVLGQVGPESWNWMRVTLLGVSASALFIVTTVPDHFLEEHLWRHVARRHALQVFSWTLGALLAMYFLTEHLDLESTIQEGKWIVLLAACLVGLIPQSGPHLIFVVVYSRGALPFSVLLASSIVQDGHGMLPLLAHSRRAFLGIKAINFVVGLLVGAALMLAGL